MATVTGIRQLEARLKAIGDTKATLIALQIAAVSEAQALVPRKTGDLQSAIVRGPVTEKHAIVEVRKNYARYVEEGTGIHGPRRRRIVPKSGKVMAWPVDGGKGQLRLSGRSRTRGGKAIAGMAFARSTQGVKPRPYLIPGAKAAAQKGGLKNAIITRWNEAA